MIGNTLDAFASKLDTHANDVRIIRGFCVDSRMAKPGFVFFALQGSVHNGHDFLTQVESAGAIAAVVDKRYKGPKTDLLLIYVEDVVAALHSVSKFWVTQSSAKILAITGSMGKTTTKELCYTLLSSRYKVFKTPGNANSQVGLPLALINDHLNYDILVLEMGMSHAGEICNLVAIAPPEVVVVTRIAPAHIEFFSDGLEGIAKAKAEIFGGGRLQCAILGSQAAEYDAISSCEAPKKIFYAKEKSNCYKHVQWFASVHESTIELISDQQASPKLPIPYDAPHLLENFIAAALVARYFLLSWEEIAKGALSVKLMDKRFEKKVINGVVFIIDCYNANPESVCQAMVSMPSPAKNGRKIAVLGPMVELGDRSAFFHHYVGKSAAENVDELFCLAQECDPMVAGFELAGKKAHYCSDIHKLRDELFVFIQEGDVVLIKASNKVGLWGILDKT